MRKSAPFRSIRLCAYTVVGAEEGVFGSVAEEKGESAEVVGEIADRLAGFGERKYQIAHASNRTETIKIAKRARITEPFYGNGQSASELRIPTLIEQKTSDSRF